MLTLVPQEIERYCQRHSTNETPLFQALAKETYEQTDCPIMQVGPLEGAFLRLLVRLSNAKRVLEIGTFTGYSTLSMAEGLPNEGELITCDIDPEATRIAQKFWAQSPHGKKIQLKLGRALETLKTLNGPFDMVFIDADKENYIHYWEMCLPKLRQGGIVAVDNVLWSGRVLNPETESDQAIVRFNTHAKNDPRVELAMLTVRDGITLAWKR